MYSPTVSQTLAAAGLSVGDRLRLRRGSLVVEGRLLPSTDAGDPDALILKLDSGYNAGLRITGATLEKLQSMPLPSFTPVDPALSKGPDRPPTDARPPNPPSPSSPSAPLAPSPSAPPRRPIHLLSTGGTIASVVDYFTGAVHPRLSAEALIGSSPRLATLAPLKSSSIMSILSEDMRPEHWTAIAQGVADAFKDGAEGLVLAHGTDTMGYTAAALSYALDGLPGPVVMTGSQRSPDRGSSDAPINLYASAAAARADWAGVALCMHGGSSDLENHLLWGTRVRKSHSSARGAFRSVGLPPIGSVMADTGRVTLRLPLIPQPGADGSLAPKPLVPARDPSRRLQLESRFSPDCHLAWVYPGLTPKEVSRWADYDGVLLAGTGLGNAPVGSADPSSPHSILPALKELTQSGVVLAMATQTLGGRVNMDVYSTGRLLRGAGVVGQGADWLVETAYVKLCWVLGHESDPARARAELERPMHGDILPRSAVEDALGEEGGEAGPASSAPQPKK